jgi:lipopolysaccharide export system protein LptA
VRFTIERIRTLVIVAGVLLLASISAFLVIGKWKNPFNRRDIPKRLGIDIEQEANGVTYTQAHAGHTIFKIHASKVVQLKNSHATLHDVQIELYGMDGSRVDRITGDEFEYDQKDGVATAAGPVVITLMRPGVKPAIATEPLVTQAEGKKAHAGKHNSQPALNAGATGATPASGNPTSAQAADTRGQIEVKTSGLVFNQQTGLATTSQQVNFSSAQGTGSSMGASYDSQKGFLVLDHSVVLDTNPSAAGGPSREPVEMHADHAEFERDSSVARLHAATAKTETEQVTAVDANLLFREDGSIAQLDATGGFTATTSTGDHIAAPTGTLKFDQDNHPQTGHLAGGVQIDSTSGGRVVHGSSAEMELRFTADGDLRHAHLQRDVEVRSQETTQSLLNGQAVTTQADRTWRSAAADVEFRKGEQSKLEPANIHGSGAVVITSETRKGTETPAPSRLAADEVNGVFGPDSALTSMTGIGHTSMEQTAGSGAHETASGDRLEVHFYPTTTPASGQTTAARASGAGAEGGTQQIQFAALEGHVVLVQYPARQPAPQSNSRTGSQPQTPLRATAGKAEYEGAGELLHLSINPRVDDGGLQLTADKVDVAQASGDALAQGNVKATWTSNGSATSNGTSANSSASQGDLALGGKGPAHAIAAEAELLQATGEATFRGHARLWQEANSVAAPTIVLNREKQTLTAKSADAAEPVRVVMVSAGAPDTATAANQNGNGNPNPSADANGSTVGKASTPSVVRVRGGDLWYSGIERRALMLGGSLGPVTVQTASAESTSNQAELFLAPAENSGSNGQQPQPIAGQSQVDRLIASGHVLLTSEGRRGTGEQLTYTFRTGDYVLTGSAAAPPRMTDPVRGNVTGEALIFHSRDNSVNVEGGTQKSKTETTAPR